jgi:hypothetical protein
MALKELRQVDPKKSKSHDRIPHAPTARRSLAERPGLILRGKRWW